MRRLVADLIAVLAMDSGILLGTPRAQGFRPADTLIVRCAKNVAGGS
jgi:hypothetical protein